jgi:hypothetical protein
MRQGRIAGLALQRAHFVVRKERSVAYSRAAGCYFTERWLRAAVCFGGAALRPFPNWQEREFMSRE